MLPLSVLSPGTGSVDVEIRTACLDETVAELRSEGRSFSVSPVEFRLVWDTFGALVVRNGREMIVDPLPGLDHGDVQLLMLGLGLAALLQQRGFLLLHASAVAVHGTAVAFHGASGWGKSTMAAALHARGHPMLVDDLVAIRCSAESTAVFPGFPEFKLWPDAVAALRGNADILPPLAPEYDKRQQRVTEGFCSAASVPLGRVYLLSSGDVPAVELLTPRQAFLELSNHSYAIRWFHEQAGSAHFQNRANIARNVPVLRLRRPRDLDLLPEIVRLVENGHAAAF